MMIPDGATLEVPSGIVNHPFMRSTLERVWAWQGVVLLVMSASCTGPTGPQGPVGPPGEPGEPGKPPDGEIEPEIFGLVGRVSEPNGVIVAGGTVYLLPSSDVEALAQTPIDLFTSPEDTALLANDEPIEDLIDMSGASYVQATVDANGEYRFETLPEGRHFVVWFPADSDSEHLPGGDSSRASFTTDSLIGMRLDIRVSSQPSPGARYVGSSTCMVCHGLDTTAATAHNVGLQVPGVRSIMQDVSRWPRFDEGLAAFDADTTLFYFDCDPASASPAKCSVSDSTTAGSVSFELRLRRDAAVPLGTLGAYYVELVNQIDPEPARRYDVVLTYGGALNKQQYLTRRTNPNGSFSYFVLPVQYNFQGDFSNPDPSDWPWSDDHSERWFDFGIASLREPDNAQSFDNNCAGCHFTGYGLEGSDLDGWSAGAVVDAQGAFDYDGDGRLELINTGCEACHGPGSEHLEREPRSSYIVSPGLLTPGREAALCGSCHSRPMGIGAGMTGLPLSAGNEMPPPGIRRADFALEHTTRVSGDPADFFSSGDPSAHYQQYSDHIRARHYRNPERILTCTGCHNPHASFDQDYGAEVAENLNVVCTACHSEVLPLLEHVEENTAFSHSTITREFRCTECHMVPVAKSGASVPALLDSIPSSAPQVQYFWNDIAGHRMSVTDRDAFDEQPVAATNGCADCHGGFFPNQ